jgi:hypothetical protein
MHTPTPVRVDPDPTRQPVATIVAEQPTAAAALVTLRIKVIVSGKGGADKAAGIRIVIYDAAGRFVAEGATDNKGDASFQVPAGSYSVGTYYNNTWQTDGPFDVRNSRVHTIHR